MTNHSGLALLLKELNKSQPLTEEEMAKSLMASLETDTKFLAEQNLIDYSALIKFEKDGEKVNGRMGIIDFTMQKKEAVIRKSTFEKLFKI